MNVNVCITLKYPRKKGSGQHVVEAIASLEFPMENLAAARKMSLPLPCEESRHFLCVKIPLEELCTRMGSGDSPKVWAVLDLDHEIASATYAEGVKIHRGLVSDGRFQMEYAPWAQPYKWTRDPRTWDAAHMTHSDKRK